MKSRAERLRGPLRAGLGIAALGALLAVATPALARDRLPLPPATGPAADYPIVLGAPFVVDGVTYTPADTLNYDRVGYAVIDPAAGPGVTIAHRTLPLPCYVEITSLRTGKTVLVRVERRGPLSGSAMVALSPGAASQLGTSDPQTPIRIRRVNPSEPERSLLRSGQRASERMDTPMSLVGVLMRRLDPTAVIATPGPSTLPAAGGPAVVPPGGLGGLKRPAVMPAVQRPLSAPPRAPEPAVEEPEPRAAMAPARATPAGAVVVQVGAFGSRNRAAAVAARVGGAVSPVGSIYRVRIGGFANAAAASAALAKAKAAGYSDARILRAD